MSLPRWTGVVLPLLVLASGLSADPPADKGKEVPHYEYRREHDRDGTGKFYMGREIAQVMGHEAAGWLDRPEREKEEQPTKMLDALKLKAGEIVADVGAGSGYLSFRMAERVGPSGKVLAVDIQPEMLALIRQRMKQRNVANIQTVLGTVSDPKLPEAGVDTIIMVDVYHEFSHPYEMSAAMVKALKIGGRIVFVEYRLEDENVPIKLVHKMSEKQVLKEMEPFPLKHVKTHGELPWQHIIVFERTAK